MSGSGLRRVQTACSWKRQKKSQWVIDWGNPVGWWKSYEFLLSSHPFPQCPAVTLAMSRLSCGARRPIPACLLPLQRAVLQGYCDHNVARPQLDKATDHKSVHPRCLVYDHRGKDSQRDEQVLGNDSVFSIPPKTFRFLSTFQLPILCPCSRLTYYNPFHVVFSFQSQA